MADGGIRARRPPAKKVVVRSIRAGSAALDGHVAIDRADRGRIPGVFERVELDGKTVRYAFAAARISVAVIVAIAKRAAISAGVANRAGARVLNDERDAVGRGAGGVRELKGKCGGEAILHGLRLGIPR